MSPLLSSRKSLGVGLAQAFGVLVVGIATYLVILNVMVSTENLNLFPSLLLVGAITVPLAVLIVAYCADQAESGSGGIVALTAIAGGIVGTTAAGFLEFDVLHRLPWLGMLAVAIIEESVKLIVPLIVFIVARHRVSGVVIGVASGTGFAVLETMGYGLTALIATRGDVSAVDATLLLRGLLSPAGHVAWTGLTVWALWRGTRFAGAAAQPMQQTLDSRPANYLRVCVLAWVCAVILHAVWDGSDIMIVHIGVVVISVFGLLALIVGSRPARRRV